MAVECTCQQCGTVFAARTVVVKNGGGKYCSRKCKDIAGNKQVKRTCEECGILFLALAAEVKRGHGKYCSQNCCGLSRRTQVVIVCPECNLPFTTKPSQLKLGYGKYCSKYCAGISLRGESSPHWKGGSLTYRGKNWVQQRKLARIRDRGICQHCGKKPRNGERKFHVHHIKPFREFNGDYIAANQLANLITLCHQCHPEAEHGKIAVQPYLL